jgi:hypothetical protein
VVFKFSLYAALRISKRKRQQEIIFFFFFLFFYKLEAWM